MHLSKPSPSLLPDHHPPQMKMLALSMAHRLEEIEAGLQEGWRWWTGIDLSGWMLGPGVGTWGFHILTPHFYLYISASSSKFHHSHIPSVTHFVPASPSAQTPAHTHSHTPLPLRFVLITTGETKTGCTCNQSCCQLGSCGSWHRLLCFSQCRVNVRYVQHVYLCRVSSGMLHTQHNAILIWPLEATHIHTHFSLFSSSGMEPWRIARFAFLLPCCGQKWICIETRFLPLKIHTHAHFNIAYISVRHITGLCFTIIFNYLQTVLEYWQNVPAICIPLPVITLTHYWFVYFCFVCPQLYKLVFVFLYNKVFHCFENEGVIKNMHFIIVSRTKRIKPNKTTVNYQDNLFKCFFSFDFVQ